MRYKKGNIPWNKGKKTGLIPKSAFSKGDIPWINGKNHTEESKLKMRMAKLGKKFSKEHKRKIGKANMGHPNYLFKHSEETKKKISENNARHWLGRGEEFDSEEMRRRGFLGVIKQQDMNGPTSIEKKVYDELKARGILFEKQKLINGKFLVDAYIPSLNLVIEADGNYWHSLDRVKKRDKSKNAYLTKCGFNLLRLTETEIMSNYFKTKFNRKGVKKYGDGPY